MYRQARKYHKWLMMFIGLQFLIWSLSGLYMVVMDIHFIHGEQLQNNSQPPLAVGQVHYGVTDVIHRHASVAEIALENMLGQPVYRFKPQPTESHWIVIDARTGEVIPPLSKASALAVARYNFAHDYEVRSVQLIDHESSAPAELAKTHLPVWRVEFDHFSSPTLYISQQNGRVVTRRHHYWRLFDWMWRFHIMDYDDGENVANWFLLIIAISGLLASIAGAMLTYQRVIKPFGRRLTR